jgi:hypothetical protein
MSRALSATFTDGTFRGTDQYDMYNVPDTMTLHQFYKFIQTHAEPNRDDTPLEDVTIYILPFTFPLDVSNIWLMALGAQARGGKNIGIPHLKHLRDSTPRDLLTNWIPLQSGIVELLIVKPARWLFNAEYTRDMMALNYVLLGVILMDYIEIEDLAVYVLWYCTHAATDQFPGIDNIGFPNPPTPPAIAANLVAANYDTIIQNNLISYAMAARTSGLRTKYSV